MMSERYRIYRTNLHYDREQQVYSSKDLDDAMTHLERLTKQTKIYDYMLLDGDNEMKLLEFRYSQLSRDLHIEHNKRINPKQKKQNKPPHMQNSV